MPMGYGFRPHAMGDAECQKCGGVFFHVYGEADAVHVCPQQGCCGIIRCGMKECEDRHFEGATQYIRRIDAMLKSGMAIFAIVGLSLSPAMAKDIPIKGQTKDKIVNGCRAAGGAGWEGRYGAYGCHNRSGGGIVCGGATKRDKKTCTIYMEVPPPVPEREDVRTFGKDVAEGYDPIRGDAPNAETK